MKTIKIYLFPVLCIFCTSVAFGQNLEKETTKLWWDIYGGCFAGTHFTKNNSLFMSTSNKFSAGSVFKLKKDLLSKIVDKGLLFEYTTLKTIKDFPLLMEDDDPAPPCTFSLDFASTTSIDVYAKLIDETNIGKISLDLQSILKKAKVLSPRVAKWGVDHIEEGQLILFLKREILKKNPTVQLLTDGKSYIATEGIWIQGISFLYDLDQETAQKIKAIYESNKAELIGAGIKMDFTSQTSFTTSFNYTHKFYPFLKFKKIQRDDSKFMESATPIILLKDLDVFDD